MPDHLIPPHGGDLVDLLVDSERASELKEASRDWPSWDLTARQIGIARGYIEAVQHPAAFDRRVFDLETRSESLKKPGNGVTLRLTSQLVVDGRDRFLRRLLRHEAGPTRRTRP